MTSSPAYPGAPRWLKIFGIIVPVLILLLVVAAHLLGVHPSHSSGTAHRSNTHATPPDQRP
jgi:hypothetical protein